MRRHSERGAASFIIGGVCMALLLIAGVGIVMNKGNSDIEKEALQKTREVANNPKAPNAQRKAAAVLPQQERDLKLRDAERALNILSLGGGPITDTLEYINGVNEASNTYAKERYGRSPGAVELEMIRARAAAMQRSMGRWQVPEGLYGNSALITKMLRNSGRFLDYLGRGQNLERERKNYPKWRKLSDDEFRAKLLEHQLSGPVLQSARAYRLVEQELRDAGLKVTPEKVNAIVKKAILGDKDGSDDFDKALTAALASATSLAKINGTYSGSYSGESSGSCHVTISGTSVSIKLFGSGENKMGAFTAKVGGSGSCNPETGRFNGTLKGTVVNQWGRYGCSGKFSGSAANNRVSGDWSASSKGIPASGTFTANK